MFPIGFRMRKAASKGDMLLLFISSVVSVQSSGDISNQNCWSQAIDFHSSFLETVCKNRSYEYINPGQLLPADCNDICTVQINTSCKNEPGSAIFEITNEMTSNAIVNKYSFGKCSECHQLRMVRITCKSDGITCTDCTIDNNDKPETDIHIYMYRQDI